MRNAMDVYTWCPYVTLVVKDTNVAEVIAKELLEVLSERQR